MKDEILSHLNDPGELEKLYRSNKAPFKRAFSALYPQLKGNTLADCWNERLSYEGGEELHWGTGREIVWVIVAALAAGLIAKLPAMLGLDEETFYQRNTGFIVLPILSAYFAWKNKLPAKAIAVAGAVVLAALLYINLLPRPAGSDSLVLACIHLPLLLWCVLGYAFVGGSLRHYERRLDFLRYNGNLAVMTALMAIAGGLLTGITIGLFSLIGLDIKDFYFEYVVVLAAAAAPVVGTYLTQTNPQLVNKVSPVIAKIFSPLVLITLVAYLSAIVVSGKDLYNDREFLLIFNALLVGVMAIIFFSVAGTARPAKAYTETLILLLLSVVTVVVNGIALSAIVFRIAQWGITPNRLAVLGSNVLMLANLVVVTIRLFKALRSRNGQTAEVGAGIALFLPVYAAWAFVVTFFFPLVFNFK